MYPLLIIRFLGLLFLIFLAAGCAVMSGYHGGVSCSTCHEGKTREGTPALRSGDTPSVTCRRCHPYENDGDHHPLSLRPALQGGRAEMPDTFQLYGGRMACPTCHRIHAKRGKGETPSLLAGGPYADRRDICRECHRKEGYIHMNPHVITPAEMRGGQERMKCLACHGSGREGGAPNEKDLKASDAFLCWRCHPVMQTDFLNRHYLLKADSSAFGAVRIEGVELLGETPLKLDPFSRLTCSTCHDPHRPYDPSRRKGTRGRVPLRTEKLCSQCHQMQ